MMRLFLALILVASVAGATPATYRDLVRARLAGATNLPARISTEPVRHVLRVDGTSAIVRVVSPDGTCSTNVVRCALMPGADRVQADDAAQKAEQAALQRLTLALALRLGTPTNALTGTATAARAARIAIYSVGAEDVAKSDALPLAGAAAAGAAAAAAAAMLRKQSTGVSTIPIDPSPSGDGTPTT
jgi:hypothetical protein